MAAVQYVQHPHYRALILRKTYADLSLPGAIMDRAISWWDGVEGARFSYADKTCYFPSGARVVFGYLASVRDHLRYQGAAVHFVGIDEASQIPTAADHAPPASEIDSNSWGTLRLRDRPVSQLVPVVSCQQNGRFVGAGLVEPVT